VGQNNERLAQAVEQLQREFNRLRRRKGSEEAPSQVNDWFLGEWNDTMVVLRQQAVTFTPSGGQAGTYVCIADAPVATDPSDATYYTLLPYPAPGVWAF
jgi:type II secretory pathway component PulJ